MQRRKARRRREESSSSDNDSHEDYRRRRGDQDEQETTTPSKPLTEEERAEIERERDLRERDEFAARLAERDKAKSKSLDERGPEGKNDAQEIARRREEYERRLARGEEVVDEATGKVLTLDRLREESRRAYLKKREERELTLLEKSLEDEKELFGESGEGLTEKERERIRLGREILKMAKGRGKTGGDDEDENDGFYRLPDEYEEKEGTKAEKDQALLSSRYVEEKGEKSEQQLWEEEQTARAAGMAGGKKGKKGEKKYDLVFEDQIDFVMTGTSAGYDKRDKKHLPRGDSRGDESDSSDSSRSRSRSPSTARAERSKKILESLPLSHREKMLEGRKKLPIYPYREELLAAIKDHQVLIVVAETGSGKTTQITQFLHEVGYTELGKVGCTQPRRVAAMSVAARVADEMDVRVGHEVGYSIRFENCTSKKTVIQYMTDGMLLREFLTEPDLASYSCLVIDEAHERTLHTDILFGLVKDIVRFRSDLKLIISSATLDAEKFSNYFDGASIFMVPGRMFPVDIYYTKQPEADYVDAAVVTVLQIHISQPLNGDILVFLTGQEEIETAAEILTQRTRGLGSRIKELIICPIYANLPSEQQAKIFEKTPKDARKVVIATNIAETSLTINGICYVIDTGFNKQKSFNARSGMESLQVTPVSQAAANQRAGRAGRTQPGKCFRLFTAWSFHNELEVNTVPEIMRTNMCNVVLMLKSLGINDLINFDFMDAPPAETLIRALEQLYALGALNDRGELTKLGRRMAEFPLEPMLSKSVIASEKYECVSEVLSTVSMLSIGASVFYRPKEKAVHADTARMNFARGGGGDHISLLRCYTEWAETDFSTQWCVENFIQVRSMRKARDIREQLEGLCERVEIDKSVSSPDDIDATLKAITAGFFYNTAKLGKSGDYQTIKQNRTVYIHPSSVLAKEAKEGENLPAWLVYFELAFTTKEFMRQVAPIQPAWLVEIAPHFYQQSDIEDARTKKLPKSRKG
jgi:pre-mRNA-splicing factor ATP-dependent RNA helicase DHX16